MSWFATYLLCLSILVCPALPPVSIPLEAYAAENSVDEPNLRYLPIPVSKKASLSLEEDNVVWREPRGNNSVVFLYDMTANVGREIGRGRIVAGPVLQHQRVAWAIRVAEGGKKVYRVHLLDLATGKVRIVHQRATRIRGLDLHGRYLAWDDKKEIWIMDLETGKARQLTRETTGVQEAPDISEDHIVWLDGRIRRSGIQEEGAGYIYLMDQNTGRETLVGPTHNYKTAPRINGRFIVWQELDAEKKGKVVLYDRSQKEVRVLGPGGTYKSNLSLSGPRIAWLDHGAKFRGPSRMALVDLDNPDSVFQGAGEKPVVLQESVGADLEQESRFRPYKREVSRDGLRVSAVEVRAERPVRVGRKISFLFSLQNTTSKNISLDKQAGAFVGARWNSETDKNIRDFGHQHKGRVIGPGQTIRIMAGRKIDKPGTWRFWPAYKADSRWGPFRWKETVIRVEEE